MDRLPSNIMLDIFSRVPGKCLARSRCVSKEWCKYIDDPYLMIVQGEQVQEPIPILYHSHLFGNRRTSSLCFHVTKSMHKATRRYYKKARVGTKQTGTADHTYVLETKEDPSFEFFPKKRLSEYSFVKNEVLGSCNGLMCLSQYENFVITSLVVADPLRKEYYEVPPFPLRLYEYEASYGLGFNASTNTLKMICVLKNDFAPACTLVHVHVFGTNSWREIPQVPSYPITGNAIFANGCLHWLFSRISEDGGRGVIWFDVEEEEFGLIDPPMCDSRRNYRHYRDEHLVDLNGEVGIVCFKTMEVWVLKQKQWVPHCRFEGSILTNNRIDVVGCWNKDGDMLISQRGFGKYKFFVYNLKSGVLHKTNIVVPEKEGCHPNIFMHPNKLISIHGIGTNSFPMKRAYWKKSCQRFLPCY